MDRTMNEPGTNDLESEDQDLLITDDEAQAAAEGPEGAPHGRDAYDDLLDNDPEFREQVKSEIRRLTQQGYQSQQAPPPNAPPDPIEEVRSEIDENDRWLEGFFETAEADRNYEEYERRKLKQMRLQRQEQQLGQQQYQQQVALQAADQVVDSWISDTIRFERQKYGKSDLENYQARVRELSRNLQPGIRSDEGKLRQALEQFVEPNAFKEYQRNPKRARRRSPAQGQGNEYMDDSPEERPKANDKYADASDEEREFLRNVGLLKDKKKDEPDGLIPIENGYAIRVGPGRRNKREGEQ